VGVNGSTGVRLRAPAGGREVTRSGSSRVLSARSIADVSARGVEESMGFEKIRLARRPHSGHAIDMGAVPIACIVSNAPSWSQRYS
jgi:hypothetical protein